MASRWRYEKIAKFAARSFPRRSSKQAGVDRSRPLHLCDSGKRDKAQEKAMIYMKEIVNSSAVKEAKRCGEMMKGAMQDMMQNMPLVDQDKDYTRLHVCDSY